MKGFETMKLPTVWIGAVKWSLSGERDSEVAQVDVLKAYDEAVVQLRLMHTVQPQALPLHSALPSQPAPDQLLSLMAAIIARRENLRRDTHVPAEAKRLHRLVKRLRKTAYDFKGFLLCILSIDV